MYHRAVIPHRERLLQLARLIGIDAFVERFGLPQAAEPEPPALQKLVEERLEDITDALVEEAAASDDVLDPESALSYLEDRLRTLAELLAPEQAERIRGAFRERTADW